MNYIVKVADKSYEVEIEDIHARPVIARVTGLLTNITEPILLSPQLSASDVRLIWTAVSNTSYRVEFTTDLSLTNWNVLPGEVTSFSNSATKVDPLTPSNRFYRVRVQR